MGVWVKGGGCIQRCQDLHLLQQDLPQLQGGSRAAQTVVAGEGGRAVYQRVGGACEVFFGAGGLVIGVPDHRHRPTVGS